MKSYFVTVPKKLPENNLSKLRRINLHRLGGRGRRSGVLDIRWMSVKHGPKRSVDTPTDDNDAYADLDK